MLAVGVEAQDVAEPVQHQPGCERGLGHKRESQPVAVPLGLGYPEGIPRLREKVPVLLQLLRPVRVVRVVWRELFDLPCELFRPDRERLDQRRLALSNSASGTDLARSSLTRSRISDSTLGTLAWAATAEM